MRSVIQNYSFNTTSKTVTLSDFSATRPVFLERLLFIADATTGTVLYNVADGTVGTASVSSNNVVTLSVLPGTSANADKLTIIYDTLPGDPQSVYRLSPYPSSTTILSTELNSLANASNTAASSAFDNSTNRYPQADLQLVLAAQGSARSTGAYIAVYMVTSVDGGSNYDDVNETTAELVAIFPLDATTSARRRTIRGVLLPPGFSKLFARNVTGQALAASASTITITPYYAQSA